MNGNNRTRGRAHQIEPDADALCFVDFEEAPAFDTRAENETRREWMRDALHDIMATTEVALDDILFGFDGELDVWNEAERRLNRAGWDTYNSDTRFEVYVDALECSPECDDECAEAPAADGEENGAPGFSSRVYVSPNLCALDNANPHGMPRPHTYRVEVLVGTVYTLDVLAYSADEARAIAEDIDPDEHAEEVDVDRVVRDVEVLDTFGSNAPAPMNVNGRCARCLDWARDCTCDDDGHAWSLYLTVNGRRTLAHDGTYSSAADVLATYTADGLDRWVLGTVDAVGADWASSVGHLPADERPTLAEWLGVDNVDGIDSFGWTIAPMTEEP